jgi:hypothetical protein
VTSARVGIGMVLDRLPDVRLDPDVHDVHVSDLSLRALPAMRALRPTGVRSGWQITASVTRCVSSAHRCRGVAFGRRACR